MKVISFCTPSHMGLYEKLFKPSFRRFDSTFDGYIHRVHTEQYTEEGNYMSDGWIKTQFNKVGFVLDYMNMVPTGTRFIFSDVDIVACNPFVSEFDEILNHHDVCFQASYSKPNFKVFHKDKKIQDKASICSGFYGMVVNDKTRNFIQTVVNDLEANTLKTRGDQYYFNLYKSTLNYKILPATYLNPGLITGGESFTEDHIPALKSFVEDHKNDLKIFHGNFTPTLVEKENVVNLVNTMMTA